MTSFFIWPHLWALAVVSAVAAGAPRRRKGLLAGLLCAGAIFLVYLALRNGPAPPPGSPANEYVVLFLLCAFPLAASGASADAFARTRLPVPVRVALTAAVGIAVLAAIPFLAIAFHCGSRGICP